LSPIFGISSLANHGTAGLLGLGAVFLAVTGTEALYADTGHLSRKPIRTAWFKVVKRRWVIERTFSWLRRNRRLMAHYEAVAIVAEGFAKLAMISLMLKRFTPR
jgi:KUP system potassium uptake protein